jgi:hypothetical protein
VYGAVVCSYDAVSLFYLELYVKLSIYLSIYLCVMSMSRSGHSFGCFVRLSVIYVFPVSLLRFCLVICYFMCAMFHTVDKYLAHESSSYFLTIENGQVVCQASESLAYVYFPFRSTSSSSPDLETSAGTLRRVRYRYR